MKRNFSSNNFILEIEHKHILGLTYIEALIEYAEDNDIELETVAAMAKKTEPLRQKIEAECGVLNLLRERPSVLPIDG